ncbi:MAG: hypothetical protein ACLFPQ_00985 [Candidatus Woesearchaeota archaeon]
MFYEGSLPYGISSYHAVSSETIFADSGERINFYDVSLHVLSEIFPLNIVSFVFPIILGMLSVFLFSFILQANNSSAVFSNISLLIFIFSPLTIYTFGFSNQFSLIVFLLTLGIALFHKKRLFILSLPVFTLLAFFGIKIAFFVMLLVFAYSMYIDKKKRYILVIALMLFTFLIQLLFPATFGVADYPVENKTAELISDLGGMKGIGILHFAVFLLGLVVFWFGAKTNYIDKMLILVFILSVFLVDYSFIFLMNMIITVIGAYGVNSLIRRKWHSIELKQITLLIIACGFIFSTLSYIDRIFSLNPTLEQVESLRFMRTSLNPGKVFSHEDYGFMIRQISGNDVLKDSFSENENILESDLEQIYYSARLSTTRELLKKYNVSYLWITQDMKQGKIWHDDDDGLLFLLRNNQTFELVYEESPSVEVWKVIWVTRYYNFVKN